LARVEVVFLQLVAVRALRSSLGLALVLLPLFLPGPLQVDAGDPITQAPCRQAGHCPWELIQNSPQLGEIFELLGSGLFGHRDPFFVLADFEAYLQVQGWWMNTGW
jgi:hypothetical protein